MDIKPTFTEAKKIYLDASGLDEITFGNTLKIHNTFVDRFTYLLSELDELENTNKDLFKDKLKEIFILIKSTEAPIKEFKKKIDTLCNYYSQRCNMEHPELFYKDKDRLVPFLIKHMEDDEKYDEI